MWIVKCGENYLTCLKEEGFGKYYCETTIVENDKNIKLFKVKEDADHDASVIGGTVVKTTEGMNEKQKDVYNCLFSLYRQLKKESTRKVNVTLMDFVYLDYGLVDDADFIPALQAFLREVEA